MINGHKVWKEREDVLDFKQVAAGETVHCLLHIFLLLHHVASDLQPQLLLELFVILRQVSARFSQVYINLWTANTSRVSIITDVQQYLYAFSADSNLVFDLLVKQGQQPLRTAPLSDRPARRPAGIHVLNTA